MTMSAFHRQKKNRGKSKNAENAGYQHLLLFLLFEKSFFQGFSKLGLCSKGLKKTEDKAPMKRKKKKKNV